MRREPRGADAAGGRFPWALAGGVLLLAAALNVGPPGPLGQLRGVLRDAFRPGLMLLDGVADRVESLCGGSRPAAPDDPTSATATRIRELELETARLRRELEVTRARGARPRGEATTPLLAPGLVTARWLGASRSPTCGRVAFFRQGVERGSLNRPWCWPPLAPGSTSDSGMVWPRETQSSPGGWCWGKSPRSANSPARCGLSPIPTFRPACGSPGGLHRGCR